MESNVLPRLRGWLDKADLPQDARLPPERDLAESLSVTRSELRKALRVLEFEGRIYRQVGRGTFVKDRAEARGVADPTLLDLLAQRTGPHEAMVARLALEPQLAHLAALHASPRQVGELRRLADAMRSAPEWETYEELDAAFHDLIAQATGTPLLHEVSRIVNAVRKQVVWGQLFLPTERPTTGYHSFDEHDAIVDAIERRDRAAARDAMRAHIEGTLATMTAGN